MQSMRTARRRRAIGQVLARIVQVAVSTAALAGCAHSGPTLAAPPATGANPAPVRNDTVVTTSVPLRVVSHNSSDLIIYAGRGRLRQRLGTVTSATTRVLTIPARFAADGNGFYLIAHRVGGGMNGDFTSPNVNVQPGQTVVWTVEFDMNSSSLSVE